MEYEQHFHFIASYCEVLEVSFLALQLLCMEKITVAVLLHFPP